jgi:hypothetical protein
LYCKWKSGFLKRRGLLQEAPLQGRGLKPDFKRFEYAAINGRSSAVLVHGARAGDSGDALLSRSAAGLNAGFRLSLFSLGTLFRLNVYALGELG